MHVAALWATPPWKPRPEVDLQAQGQCGQEGVEVAVGWSEGREGGTGASGRQVIGRSE